MTRIPSHHGPQTPYGLAPISGVNPSEDEAFMEIELRQLKQNLAKCVGTLRQVEFHLAGQELDQGTLALFELVRDCLRNVKR